MKNFLKFAFSLAAAGVVLPAGLFAQAPSAATSPTPSVSVPAGPTNQAATGGTGAGQGAGRWREAMATLTPQERQELMAAHTKAMSDPAVKAAETLRGSNPREFHRVMVEATIRADPNVARIFEKMRAATTH